MPLLCVLPRVIEILIWLLLDEESWRKNIHSNETEKAFLQQENLSLRGKEEGDIEEERERV